MIKITKKLVIRSIIIIAICSLFIFVLMEKSNDYADEVLRTTEYERVVGDTIEIEGYLVEITDIDSDSQSSKKKVLLSLINDGGNEPVILKREITHENGFSTNFDDSLEGEIKIITAFCGAINRESFVVLKYTAPE